MKYLLLSLFCMLSTTVFAQIDQEAIIRKKLEDLKRRNDLKMQQNNVSTLPYRSKNVPPLSYLKDPKPGIYRLPQDGMPCLVPDTHSIAAIPNAAPRIEVPFRSRIPNGVPLQSPLHERSTE